MSRDLSNTFSAFAITVLLACAGCGGENLGSPVKIAGTVAVDGQPLSGAVVTFHCVSGLPPEHRTQQATTGPNGEYEAPGVYPGNYEVTVTDPATVAAASADPGMQPAQLGEELKPATGGDLKLEVKADATHHIRLTKGHPTRLSRK